MRSRFHFVNFNPTPDIQEIGKKILSDIHGERSGRVIEAECVLVEDEYLTTVSLEVHSLHFFVDETSPDAWTALERAREKVLEVLALHGANAAA